MVYSEHLSVAVVSGNKIVREVRTNGEDVVPLPFGTDYGLRIKNHSTKRAVVSVEIDGKDVLDGKQLIVEANDTCNLEGFMEGYTVRNKFRFIKTTEATKEHRGDFIDDGLIRVSWQYEEPYNPPKTKTTEEHHYHHHHDHHYWDDYFEPYKWPKYPKRYPWESPFYSSTTEADNATHDSDSTECSSPLKSIRNKDSVKPQSFYRNIETSAVGIGDSVANDSLEDGFTAQGSQTNQDFGRGYVGQLESEKHVIVLKLKGTDQKNQPVVKVISTRDRISCPSCGKKNKSGVQFCPRCGTGLR